MMKKMVILLLTVILLTGCQSSEKEINKVKDLEFTVVEEEQIPEKLWEAIDGKKEQPFKLTYSDRENLYIAVGFGEQGTGGYSVAVNELYLADNAIYFNTDLMGPLQDEVVDKAKSFPYIVVKVEYIDKSVIFQ